MNNYSRIIRWLIFLPALSVVITSTILTYKYINQDIENTKQESIRLEKEYIGYLKDKIQGRVERVINLVELNIKTQREKEKKNIKDIVNIGYNNIKKIYLGNKNLNKNQVIKIIKTQLKDIRFYDNASGYYFIIDKNNTTILHPLNTNHEDKDMSNLQDKKGKYFIKSFTDIALNKKEGFDEWHWYKPNQKDMKKKIGYIKYFEPLGIYIGSAKYEEDIESKIKEDILNVIGNIRYGKDRYVFVVDNINKITLSHINKAYIGKDINKLNKREKKIILNIIKKGKKKNGSFLGYTPISHNINNKKLSDKISYVKSIPYLEWTIGTGVYTQNLQKQIENKKELLNKNLNNNIKTTLIVSIGISLIIIALMFIITTKLKNIILSYEKELASKTKKLKELNSTLEERIKKEVSQSRKKDEILFEQSKMAAMGEMLGNIAHQWRQPLSAISTASSGLKIRKEFGMVDDKEIDETLDSIVENTKLLSSTIDDFRNFFKRYKDEEEFLISDIIKKTHKLVEANFKNNNIEIKENIEDFKLFGLANELTQAILNILNNAKDAFEDKEDEDKYIFINSYKKEDSLVLEIIDSAGGIKKDILNKVFEPYFTTKFESQGTGIGLHMTRQIICKHMNGNIYVENSSYLYKKQNLTGAKFTITLPIKKG